MTNIPEETKRIVRQQAGFGCCKCGLPIIEYHHIVKESTNLDEIMLLCPICHHEATVGAMTKDEQVFHKKNPKNIKDGFVEGKLKINQSTPATTLGNNQFIGTGNFLLVDGESLLSIEIVENRLEISLKLYDMGDNLVAKIINDEWVSGDPLPWDLESSFQWLRIRRKLNDISLDIDARKYPLEIKADLWRKGQNFQLRPDKLLFNGVVTQSGFVNLCLVAMSLQANTSTKSFSMVPDPRYGNGALVSNSNISERVKQGLEAWTTISCIHESETIVNKKKYTVEKCKKCGTIKKEWCL
jgi:hypothetical protein